MINKNKRLIIALIKKVIAIRDEAIDHKYDIERDFAADIAHYLSAGQLPKALIACRNAVDWSGYYTDGFKNLADGIVNLIDAGSRTRIIDELRSLVARVSALMMTATDAESHVLQETRRHLLAASIAIEGGEPSHEPETPIYETLAPDDCLIISKDGDSLLVACNNDGELVGEPRAFRSKIDDAGTWDVEDFYTVEPSRLGL